MTKIQALPLDLASFEILHDIPGCIEESDCSYYLDLESIIREERHQWQESK